MIISLIGYAITLAIFILTQWGINSRFKRKQENEYIQFQTTTNLKLAEFNEELAAIKSQVQLNKSEIIDSYRRYKAETLEHTKEFRAETAIALKENKDDHTAIYTILTTALKDLAFIRGKIEHLKTIK
jgi:hypothetical protein